MKSHPWFALATALFLSAIGGDGRTSEPHSKFPPTTAIPIFTVNVGAQVTVGGLGATNFLPNRWMDVYVVPHRTWRDGDPLGANAVQRGRVRSDAQGTLQLIPLWKAGRPGRYDIIVDYDGDARFSYALDALEAIDVRIPNTVAVR